VEVAWLVVMAGTLLFIDDVFIATPRPNRPSIRLLPASTFDKSITVTNHLDETIILELRSPEKSGLLIQEVTGLGPSKANINSTELSTMDGSAYNSARMNSRNIVMTLKIMDTPSVEYNRLLSYKYFPVKKKLRLRIETDSRTCDIYGYVESNEPSIFSSSVTTQISIICPDPYFYSSSMNITMFAGVIPTFTFPFSNESLTEDLIEVGEISDNQEPVITYLGDTEVGMNIFIHSIGSVTNLRIFNLYTNELMRIDDVKMVELTGSGIVSGDNIVISTIKGQKSITLLRGGLYLNILNCLDVNVDWFQLVRGENVFAFVADTGVTNLDVRIENQTLYEGV